MSTDGGPDYDPESEAAENAAYRAAVRAAARRSGQGGQGGQQPGGDPSPPGPVLEVAVLGSGAGCDLVLADPEVAGRHVEVRRHAGGVLSVRPLATSGVVIHRLVGGRRRRLPVAATTVLAAGDVLQVGSARSAPWRPR